MRLASLGLLVLIALPQADYPRYVTPEIRDVTIATRTDYGSPDRAMTTRVRLKGARQVREQELAGPNGPAPFATSISQCDTRQILILNHEARTYAYLPIEDERQYLVARASRGRPVRTDNSRAGGDD
jgi:hypothetical protein